MGHRSSITNYNVLPPTVVRTIHEAFDDAVKTLETRWGCETLPSARVLRTTVAREIVDLAKHGECDFIRLREGGLKAMHFEW